jgi:hypothetical protein
MNSGGEVGALERQPAMVVDDTKSFRLVGTVVMREFVSETVLMEINSGRYYSFDAKGGLLLKALVERGSIEGALSFLNRLDPLSSVDELRGELSSLVNKLRSLNLLR